MNLPKRKQNRLKNFDYGQNGAYFITICTANRKKIFWNNVGADNIRPQNVSLSHIGEVAQQGVLQIATHYENVFVDKYCIMPDHIHLILRIELDVNGRIISAPTVSTIIGSMKRWVSKQIGEPIWQKSFYDHGIRNQADYDEAWEYIENNSRKWILTHNTQD